MTKISIITKAYNVIDYVAECAESVINQSFNDFEWIVLDNACNDGTSEILKEYADKDDRIKLFTSSRNDIITGIRNHEFEDYVNNINSEYVCHLDSDDYLDIDFLKVSYEKAIEDNYDIVVSGCRLFMNEDRTKGIMRVPPQFQTDDIKDVGNIFNEAYGCFRPMWQKIIKTSLYLESAKIFNITKAENATDTIFNLQALKICKSIAFIDKVLTNYRIRDNSHYNANATISRYMEHIIIFDMSKSLLSEWNKLEENHNFICNVLSGSLIDCLSIIAKSNNALIFKIKEVNKILGDTDLFDRLNERGLYLKTVLYCHKAINEIIQESEK